MKKILIALIVLTISSCKTTHFVKSEYEKFVIVGKDDTNGFCFYQIVKKHSNSIRYVSVDKDCLYNIGDTLTISQVNSLKN